MKHVLFLSLVALLLATGCAPCVNAVAGAPTPTPRPVTAPVAAAPLERIGMPSTWAGRAIRQAPPPPRASSTSTS